MSERKLGAGWGENAYYLLRSPCPVIEVSLRKAHEYGVSHTSAGVTSVD